MPDPPPPGVVLREQRTLLGGWTVVREYDVENLADGRHSLREVVHRPDIAVVLPFSRCRGTATLVAQDRAAAHVAGWTRPLLEAPSGQIDVNETPEQAARRELREETGLVASKLECCGSLFLHPALTVERAFLFVCDLDSCLLWQDDPVHDDLLGRPEIVEVALPIIKNAPETGLVVDAKTILLSQYLRITMPHLFEGTRNDRACDARRQDDLLPG